MSQLSFFSADLTPPRVEDLGGLLAANGQISRSADGARLSILLPDEWRAKTLLREFRVRDVEAEYLPAAEALSIGLLTEEGTTTGVLLRSSRTHELDALAREWTRGAVKSVPSALVAAAGLMRCWTLAAGRHDEAGYLLGLDRHAVDTWEPLASACARAGLAGALIGPRGGGPALRIVGHRRHARLVELLGTPPPEAPKTAFPLPEH
ncbi:hypothetical protein ABIB25_004074 [Nakamurella sp. UYEF19]|uniref:hypothetical protein n=1 Tax=Nakamurella sp. UYEF19 TaxID=1756392 RepID=UPI003399C72E